MIPQTHTLTNDLKKCINKLKETYAELFLTFDNMIQVQKPNLEALYQKEIGQFELEVFFLHCDLKRLQRKKELIQAALNRNEYPNEKQIDKILETEFEEWKVSLRVWAESVESSKKHLNSQMSSEVSKQLTSLYHALAKTLHPDLNPNQTEVHKGLWYSALYAYENRDIDALKTLWDYVTTSIPINFEKEESHLETLMQERETWEVKINKISSKISNLSLDVPFRYKSILSDPAQIENKRNEIEGLKKNLQMQIEQLKANINLLT
ncbi:MAG: hypothetical protein SFU91_00065 [Chloroherpetonaceae bacterium]|nr:hypothetical protein [Chloroherpetonaceae bacterium]